MSEPGDQELHELARREGFRSAGSASALEKRSKRSVAFRRLSKNLYNGPVKRVEFLGSSLDDLRRFPVEARRAAGFELGFVQRGLAPSDWRPMPDVGPGVNEIRLHVGGERRVLYVAKFAAAI